MNVLVNFELQKRVIALTLDNASANNVAIEIMRTQLSGYHEELFHIRYGCHIVILIVKDGLELLQEPINKIRSSIVYISNSSSRVASFKGLCRAYNKRPGIFGPDEQHRWNSTYVMLKEVIEHRDVITMWINKELNKTFLEDRIGKWLI